MSSLSLKHIYKVYDGNVKAVNDFCMEIEDKEFIVFVGPSGCGKSTTLRMIAGLEEITAGELRIDDEIVNDYEPKDRNIAMVFQNYALYPHMSIFDNMAFSLKIAHLPKEEIKKKVYEAADILGITEYLDRKPKALSGGQRQRVALGRAIVRNPKVFLLDEPLSNLDAKLRANMRAEITRLHNRLQTTFIYVTHDQVEAMTMGSRIVVMKDGYVQQIDTPQNLYKYPSNIFVAGFIGTPQMNFFDATAQKKGGIVNFALACNENIPVDYSIVNKILLKYLNGEHDLVVGIRPDDIQLYDVSHLDKDWHHAKVIVRVIEALGSETLLNCSFNLNEDITRLNEDASLTIKVGGDCEIKEGDIIDIDINKHAIHVFDKESGVSVKTRLPKQNELCAQTQDGFIKFAGQTAMLPKSIASKVENGDYVLTIPTDAIRLGEGYCLTNIVGKEQIEGKTLYQLDTAGVTMFALCDEDKYDIGASSFAIDFTRISLSGECEVSALCTTNEIPGTFVKCREKNELGKNETHYYLQIGEQRLPSNDDITQKLISCKGHKIFKTPLSFVIQAQDVMIGKTDMPSLVADVVDILDYGDKVYMLLDVEGNKLIAPLCADCQIGDRVEVAIDMSKLAVKDSAIDIRIY